MTDQRTKRVATALIPTLVGCWFLSPGSQMAMGQESTEKSKIRVLEPLPAEHVQVQGIRRVVRFYQPQRLSGRPALVLVLHGGGGDGERFRRFTEGAFETLADEQGFLVAYPDALGGQWNGCRAKAPYHEALTGIDEVTFLRVVVRRAADVIGRDLTGVFAVGYSNGGHLIFRLALEAPGDFAALAAIGAHLPVPEELDCGSSDAPVSILVVSGTDDPINPWGGGKVVAPGGAPLGQVVSAEATAAHFVGLLNNADTPKIERHPDRDRQDGTRVETRRWLAHEREVGLIIVHGGGHTLPHPTAAFPVDLVGRTSRDIDGSRQIWSFFARQLDRNRTGAN